MEAEGQVRKEEMEVVEQVRKEEILSAGKSGRRRYRRGAG